MNLSRVFFLSMALAFVAPPAFGQTADKRQQVKEHYSRATRLYDVGEYAQAIEEYQKAYLISDDPAMLYNIAQCHRLADHPVEALRFYRNYLRRAPEAPNRPDVEKKIVELEKIVEARGAGAAAAIVPPPPPARPAPMPPPAPVAPPSVAAGAPFPPPIVETPHAAAASPVPSGADLTKPSSSAPAVEERSRLLPYSLLIGGGVLVTTSMILGTVARSKARQVENAAKNGQPFNPQVEKAGKNASGGAAVTGLLGVAAVGTGVWFWFRDSSAEESQTEKPAAPHAIIFPIAAPGLAGAGAAIAF